MLARDLQKTDCTSVGSPCSVYTARYLLGTNSKYNLQEVLQNIVISERGLKTYSEANWRLFDRKKIEVSGLENKEEKVVC